MLIVSTRLVLISSHIFVLPMLKSLRAVFTETAKGLLCSDTPAEACGSSNLIAGYPTVERHPAIGCASRRRDRVFAYWWEVGKMNF